MRRLTLLFIVLLPLFAACQDMKNMDDEAHVLSLGIDMGEERRFRFTFQIPAQTAATVEKGGFTLQSAEADSLYEAIDLINVSLPWRLSFAHLSYILFSDELAANGALKEFVQLTPSSLGFRTTCSIVVVKGETSDFLEGMQGDGELNLARQQRTWMLEPSKSGMFPECTYAQLAESLINPVYTALLPMGSVKKTARPAREFRNAAVGSSAQTEFGEIEAGQEEEMFSEMLGCALLKDGVMVAEFDANETLALMLARDAFQQGWYYDEDNGNTAVDLSVAERREVRVLSWEPLELSLRVFVKGDVAFGFGINANLDEAQIARIEQMISESLSAKLTALFEDCKRLDADAFLLGKSAIAHFATNERWKSYEWPKRIMEARLEIVAAFSLNRYRTAGRVGGEP